MLRANLIQFPVQYGILLAWGAVLACLARFRTTRLYREVLVAAEWTLAAALVGGVIVLQVAFWTHAGGLWRDEANSVNLATVPRIGDIWDHLDGDSFPMLWLLVLRAWAWIGFAGSDQSIRALALLSALGILAAILWNARASGVRFPVITLLLVACNPVFVRCVGSNRAYGLGIALLLLTYGAVGALLRCTPDRRRFALASVFAVLAVQCLFYNTVFVWVITGSAAWVSLIQKDRQRAAACAAVGVIATITMLPYAITVQKQHAWSAYIATPQDIGEIVSGLVGALEKQGPFSGTAGVCLCGFALVFAVRYLARRGADRPARADADRVLFNALCLALSTVAIVLFLWALKYTVRSWYFAGYLALAGLALDTLVAMAIAKDEARRTACVACTFAVALASVVSTQQAVMTRQTNIDVVASVLMRTTGQNDRIVVVPWYFGTSFERYYRGRAVWQSVPPLEDYRFDFVRNMISAVKRNQTIEPDLSRMRETLRSGGRVLVVGDLPSIRDLSGWHSVTWEHRRLDTCLISWYTQIRTDLKLHSTLVANACLPTGPDVNADENARIEAYQSWHDAPGAAARLPARLAAAPPSRLAAVPPARSREVPVAASTVPRSHSATRPPGRSAVAPSARSAGALPAHPAAMPPARSALVPPARLPAMALAQSAAVPPVRSVALLAPDKGHAVPQTEPVTVGAGEAQPSYPGSAARSTGERRTQ